MSPTPVLGPQRLPLLAITVLVFALVVAAGAHGWRLGALAGVGVLFGASLFHASFGFASGYRRLSRKKALPYVAKRWTWLNQTPALTAALVREEKENYNDLAEALSMGLGPLASSSMLAKGGFWPSPQTWQNDSWSFELVYQPKPFTMLIGTKLLAKAKELGDVSKSDLARPAGYVSTKKNGMERLNDIALYEALLEANGMHLGAGGWGRRGGLNLPLNQELLKLDLPQVRRILGNGRCILSC